MDWITGMLLIAICCFFLSQFLLKINQLLDVSVGFGGKHKSSCYLMVVPKEGWHYDSTIISNSCSDCEKYRDQALAILKLPNKIKEQ